MIQLLDDLPDGTIGIRLSGRIEAQDYKKTLDPAIEEELATHDKINAVVVVDPAGIDYTAGAMWQDTKLGLRHPLSWGRVALVSDSTWADRVMPMLSAIMPGEFRTFSHDDEAAARSWASGST